MQVWKFGIRTAHLFNIIQSEIPVHMPHTRTHKVAWGKAGHAVTSGRSPSRGLLPAAIESMVLRSNPERTHAGKIRARPRGRLLTHNLPFTVSSSRCTFRHLASFFQLRLLQRWHMRDMSGGLPVSRPRSIPTCVFHRRPWIMQSPSPAFSTQAAAPPYKHTVHTLRVCVHLHVSAIL